MPVETIDSVTVNVAVVVPEFPSVTVTLLIASDGVGTAPIKALTFSRPPVDVIPFSDDVCVTVFSRAVRIWLAVALGFAAA